MTEIEQLSSHLKKRMKEMKLTQIDLANHTGLGLKTVRAIILGKEGTSIKNWMTVAHTLGFEFELQNKKLNNEKSTSI